MSGEIKIFFTYSVKYFFNNYYLLDQIYVNLLTESDCLKWLGDFEEKTNTEWKVDKDATRISQSNKVTIRVLQITNYYIEICILFIFTK